MILTGSEINREKSIGNIVISPFSKKRVNPNSYNYRLGHTLKVFDYFDGEEALFKIINIPKSGYVLKPKKMYLASTLEIIGSKKYAMSLIGRSSMGRLGLFLQVSANLGHTASCHKWTLEIVSVKSIKIYPGMTIGQVSFWCNNGKIEEYGGKYGFLNYPQERIIS